MNTPESGLRAKLEQKRGRLVREVETARQSLTSIEQDLEDSLGRNPLFLEPGQDAEASVLQARGMAEVFWMRPLDAYQRQLPLRRILAAIEEFWRGAAEAAAMDAPGSRAEQAAWRLAADTSEPAGQLVLQTMRGIRGLLDPWEILKSEVMRVAGGAEPNRQSAVAALDHWKRWRRKREEHAASHVGELWKQLGRAVDRIAAEAEKPGQKEEQSEERAEFEENLDFWWKRQRAIAEEMAVERRMIETNRALMDASRGAIETASKEKQKLLAAASEMAAYISRFTPGASAFNPPEPRVELATAEQRLKRWERESLRILRESLPEELEVCEPKNALPGWRNEWRTIRPRKACQSSFEEVAKPVLKASLDRVLEGDALLLREIEHAREVMDYGLNCMPEDGAAVFEEARTNSVTLLQEAMEQAVLADSGAKDAAMRGTALALADTATKLEMGRSSLIAAFTKRRGKAYLEAAHARVRSALAESLPALESKAAEFGDKALIAIGWKLPPAMEVSAVETRASLQGLATQERRIANLPGLYRRLFAFAPVEDPRYLVGREDALEGLQRSLEDWRTGKFAACIVVGARGSGKTSLLNCAVKTFLSEDEVIASQFEDRLQTTSEVDQFFRKMCGAPDEAGLEEALRSRRRIILLEETERCFLKSIHGFDGFRRLQSLIQTTGRDVLWILSVNNQAFDYLDHAFGFGRIFSRRVNAMSISRESMERAILQRHSLSGLRLKFLPSSKQSGLLRRDIEKHDPRAAFFEALHQESGGVLRSAFEMWLNAIESAEGGAVTLRFPEDANYESVHGELSQADKFTLLALQQHGSLTHEELAECLFEKEPAARMQLERLTSMGLLEQDPRFPGLRVLPEAQRLVASALMRENLT